LWPLLIEGIGVSINHIEPHVLYGVQPNENLSNEDIQKGLDQVTDPWQQADDDLKATCHRQVTVSVFGVFKSLKSTIESMTKSEQNLTCNSEG
jgi:hypothetical protein